MITSSPASRALRPVVNTQCGLAARFFAFCSSGPVVKCRASSRHTAMSGVTWGWPAARTVDSQYTGAFSSSRRASAHAVGGALSLLNRESRSVFGSRPSMSVSSRSTCRGLQTSARSGTERGPQRVEVGGAEDDPVAGGDVEEVEVHAGLGDLASEVGEHAGAVFDVDDDDFSL